MQNTVGLQVRYDDIGHIGTNHTDARNLVNPLDSAAVQELNVGLYLPQYLPGPNDYWFEHFQPFNGLATKDFGYQVTLKLTPVFKTTEDKRDEGNAPEELPAPEKKPTNKP